VSEKKNFFLAFIVLKTILSYSCKFASVTYLQTKAKQFSNFVLYKTRHCVCPLQCLAIFFYSCTMGKKVLPNSCSALYHKEVIKTNVKQSTVSCHENSFVISD
jgi:hypothetical protein